MRHALAAVLCIALPIAMFASDNGYKVTYDGGSLPETKAGAGMKIYIEANQVRLTKDNVEVTKIPASAITEISYGQDVHRRVGTAVAVGVFTLGVGALVALSKSKKHYIGLIWADGDKIRCNRSASVRRWRIRFITNIIIHEYVYLYILNRNPEGRARTFPNREEVWPSL